MNWSTSVLTTLSSDTEPTIIVTFDSAKYIFNAGENTNRAFLQSRGNWKRTRGLFFTDVGTKRSSGLPGLLMSFADATISNLSIVGPPGLLHFMAAMRLYTFRDTLSINPIESSWTLPSSLSPDPLYKDGNITVYGIPILPTPKLELDNETLAYTSETSPLHTSPDAHLKRKRDPSPDLPEKRPLLTTTESMENCGSPTELQDGLTAQEWRKLMIDTMFPGLRGKESKVKESKTLESSKKKPRKGKGRNGEGSHSKELDAENHMQHEGNDSQIISTSGDAVSSEQANDPSSAATPSSAGRSKRPRPPLGFRNQLPKFIPHTPPESPTKPTLAYVVVGPRIRGKFDVEKAEALGVHGPLRGKLTRGQTVTLKVKLDGVTTERVVRPEDCIGESEAPGVILILDIPTPMHIPALISSFENSPFYSRFRSRHPEDLKAYAVRSIFHICGKGVLEDQRYVAFMNGFMSDVHHIIASRDYSPDPVTFTSVAFNQLRLNQLDPEIFPLPKFSLRPLKPLETIPNLPPTSCLMASGQLINMRSSAPPIQETSAQSGDSFHPAILSETPPPLPALTLEHFSDAKKNVEDHVKRGKLHIPNGADVKVIPLGTGSAIPTKYRNVSSTLIQIPHYGNILLDAGEGTWGQLVRQFGSGESPSSNVWDVLRDLKCIFISHVHADHHMGIAQILAKRRQLDPPPSQPLYLVSIRAIHLYLRELSNLQDLGLYDPSGNGVVTIMSEALHWRKTGTYQSTGMWQVDGDEPWLDLDQSHRNAAEMCRALGLESFDSVDVHHKTRCFGAVLKHTDGWSIVFSADTQPTNTLVWAGKNATLLIHEATMADDQAEMAAQKAHSTFGQAIKVGRNMNAEHILLTHFSARYPKMPPSGVAKPNQIEEDSLKKLKEPIVALAFDHANLTIGSMWKINYYLSALEQSFRDTVEEDDGEDADPIGMDVGID